LRADKESQVAFKVLGVKLRSLLGGGRLDESFFEELEDLLIEADIGAATTMEITDELREMVRREKLRSQNDIFLELKGLLKGYIKVSSLALSEKGLNVVLVLGVNGVGKTTTIAKLGNIFNQLVGAEQVLLCAGDTFRAAAIDQLTILGDRLGVRVVSQQPGADPGAVIYDGIQSAISKDMKLIIADTAGRMHNKANLVKELQKIDKIISRSIEPEAYHTMLVIDATTGQNGYQQAEIFNEAVGVDSIALAKYDSSAKGGIVISICRQLGIPFSYLGMGEQLTDLVPFEEELYLNSLLGIE
jgi:fused signal recognition particle receptor